MSYLVHKIFGFGVGFGNFFLMLKIIKKF